VTFVAEQLLGYFRTGGLGTATTFLALAFSRLGHEVEVLYFGEAPPTPVDPEWLRLYAEAGVRIREVPHVDHIVEPSYFKRMREIELALREDPPDVVVTQDLGAPGYSALRLRSLGLAFSDTLFVVFCHGTRQWITNMSRKVRVLPGALAVANLERIGVELADVAVSPSAYMLDWMRGQRWRLPERTEVIPLLTRSAATGEPRPVPARASNGAVSRVAFFGRLEERKGVRPFVAALNALPAELLAGVDVAFVGRPTPKLSPRIVEAMLSEATRRHVRSISFQPDLDQHEALEQLGRPGTLAVIPSLEDNSPNVVYECIEHGIPFIASGAGGTAELIAPEDRDRVLFEPTADGVATALHRTLASGAVPEPPRAAFDGEASLERWAQVLELEPTHAAGLEPTTLDEARWQIRLDEDDEPAPELVETLCRAQATSGADVVTCGLRLRAGGGEVRERFFSGEPGGLGLVGNDYGTVALVRRSLLNDVAPVDARDPDWPLYAAMSAHGAKIVSVPLPLVERHGEPGSLERDAADALLVVGELEQTLPRHLCDLARLAAGLVADSHRAAPARASVLRRIGRRLRRWSGRTNVRA
jgi:glycosyltransferase involved in cell wall biosynthesis